MSTRWTANPGPAPWALNEAYVYDDQGRMLNPGFLDYRMPVAVCIHPPRRPSLALVPSGMLRT